MKEDICSKIESKIKAKKDSRDKGFDMGGVKAGGKHTRECGVVLFSLPPVKMLMPGDNLTICSHTFSLCSKVGERDNHKEQPRRSKRQQCSTKLDRWHNLEKERGRESYEFKN